MKRVFDTYKEAVISNGTTKCVYKNEITGEFCHLTQGCPIINICWVECNPADHLESLESFLTSGNRLVSGDLITYLNGAVKSVENPKIMNTFADSQNQRYVLQAAADHVETPEEREEFDRLAREHDNEANQAREMDIDTTPQQVESLSNPSEIPDSSEWDGEGLPPAGTECEFKEKSNAYSEAYKHWSKCKILAYNKAKNPSDELQIIIRDNNGDAAIIYSCDGPLFRKPETPAEREQRERLEAARELYLSANKAMQGTDIVNHYNFDQSECVWLALVDKTDYRKEAK